MSKFQLAAVVCAESISRRFERSLTLSRFEVKYREYCPRGIFTMCDVKHKFTDYGARTSL